MNSFDFDYYMPENLMEAVECFHQLDSSGKTALYYGGGTEIISMARAESIRFDAVIDIKNIAECRVHELKDGVLTMGAALTLTEISEAGRYPLLCETVSRIADHTIQDKITLGGNLAGTIKYREAALPLMLSDCEVEIMTPDGLRRAPFSAVFKGRLKLRKGDFLVKVMVDEKTLLLPYVHAKKTKGEKIDYPLITLAAHKNKEELSAAVSSLAESPMLLPKTLINDTKLCCEERADQIINHVNPAVITDLSGSKEYRLFVLRNMLLQMYKDLEDR